MMYRYNQREAKVSFNTWCEQNGIEVVDSWDAGMYGNIGFTVRLNGVEHKASGYQSIGLYGGNFKFDLVVTESEEV